MDENDIKTRVLDQSDDNPTIHAIYKTGEDSPRTFYLVLAEKFHEGRRMMKLRYFAAHDSDPSEDTWMKNGINMRWSDEFGQKLAQGMMATASGKPDDDTIDIDLSDLTPQ